MLPHQISRYFAASRFTRVLLFALLFFVLCPLSVSLAVDIIDEDTLYTALHTAGVHELQADVVANTRPMSDYQLLGVGNCTVNMNGNSITMNQIITIQGGTHLTFQGAGMLVKSVSAANSRLFYCNQSTSAASLTINGPTLDTINSNTLQTVYLSGSSTVFNFISGAIQNSTISSSDGGAIFATSNATINMSGGTITNCSAPNGGAISLTNNATINMSGGSITGNTAGSHGGGITASNATVYISDSALISNNTAGDNGGGLYISNGTICQMTGGTISQNTAHVSSSFNGGGGIAVYSSASFSMSGGLIAGNISDAMGGGVCVYGSSSSASAVFSGNAVISGNTSTGGGGGVYASAANMATRTSITVEGNTQIVNNISGGDGGGLYLPIHSDGLMSGGTITGNQSNLSAASINTGGGGVYVGGMLYPMAYSSFIFNGGAIYHNTSNSSGNDIIGAFGARITLISALSMGLPQTTVNGWYWDQYGDRFADAVIPVEYTPVVNDNLIDIMAGYYSSEPKPVPVSIIPQTGDSSNMLLYIALAIVSLLGFYTIMRRKFV